MNSHNRQEIEADEFAAELLMPERSLRRDVVHHGLDAPALAKLYRVSEPMWMQLISLKLAGQHSRA